MCQKLNRCYLKEILNLSKLDKISPQFDQLQTIDSTKLKIDTVDSGFSSDVEIKQLLEQRIEKAVSPIVQLLLTGSDLGVNRLNLAIENILKKIPSVQIQYYFRAGKNYFTINHQMGYAGNILFKIIFDTLLKENNDKSYRITHENSFCVICRN